MVALLEGVFAVCRRGCVHAALELIDIAKHLVKEEDDPGEGPSLSRW